MQIFPLKLLVPSLPYIGRVNNKVHGNNNNQHDDNNDINGSTNNNSRTRSLCSSDTLFLSIIILFLVVVFLVVVPILDQYDGPSVPEFQVDSLVVTSMKIYNNSKDYYSIVQDEKHITADLDFTLSLKNKDEDLIHFDPMQVLLEYHQDGFLSSTSIGAFLLDEKQHQLQFKMRIKDDAHLQNGTVDSISRNLWGENVIQFALKGEGHYVRWHRIYFDKCGIKLVCDDIKVGFLPANNLTTGSMIDSPLPCKSESACKYVYY